MVIVVAVVVVLLLVAGAAWLVRRRGGDETHSVEGYRNTMDTLQGIRSRSSSGSVRVLGQDNEPPEGDAPARPGPVPASGPVPTTPRLPRPGGPGLVFEDPAGSPPPGGSLPSGGRRGQDRAISAMNHRPRRLGAPVAVAVVVVVLLVVVVVIGARAQGHHHTATTTTQAGGRSSQTTTTPGGSSGTGGKSGHGGKGSAPSTSTSTTTTTTTTVPSSFTPVSSTATTGTYVPPAAAYSVTLSATTGQCWLTVRSAGTTVFSQTLAAGQSKSLSMTGSSTIEIGAPSSLTVTLDHKPVVLPPGYQTPFVITLQPAAGTSTTGTTTTTITGGTGTA